jgi:subtilisin family serine protease
MPKLGANLAWDSTTGASNITVAVIDTGFALSHEDLAGHWALNAGEMGTTSIEGAAPNCTSRGLALDKSCNNLDNDADGYPSDWRGWDFVHGDNDPSAGSTNPNAASAFHGSYVAGLVGASGNNSHGVAGVAWGVKLMPLQVLDDNGSGYTDQIAAAIHYAADHGAKVISLSLGAYADDPYVHAQITYAIARGATVVAAAGNDGCNCMLYPANYPETLAVGASTATDTLASFSSYGANLDIIAPGTDGVCSVYWTSGNPTSGYSCGGSGTSFATPLVSGAIALLLSKSQQLTPAQVISDITGSALKPVGMQGQYRTDSYGYGRLNIYGALLQIGTVISPYNQSDSAATTISLATPQAITSVCQAPTGSSCSLRLVGPGSQVINLGTKPGDVWGGAVFFWDSSAVGLTAGNWILESYNTSSNLSTSQSPAQVTVIP